MTTSNGAELRYNDVRQKSVHNTFQRRESIADQFLYWRVRSMEIDVHHADVFGNTTKGDWSVHHDWYDPISTVSKLSQYLRMMRGLNRLVPKHEVTTLFIDIKDPFPVSRGASHGSKAFDALLDEHLGSRLFRPKDLLKRVQGATTLRGALEQNGWPTLRELRGKFIVVLTGSSAQLANYATGPKAAVERSAFLSAPVDVARDIPGKGDEIFFNISGETHMGLVDRVHPLGFVARAYYLNTWELWRTAANQDCHHLATDQVNERIDAWASTRNVAGFPFQRLDGSTVEGGPEHGQVCGIWAHSDDLWSEEDSFQFNYRKCTPSTYDNTYDFGIAGPNSHIEDFAKGAVLARQGLEPDDAYFGVVRVGQKHGLRVQFRARAGGPTTATTPEIGPMGFFGRDIDQDTIVHVRLKLDRGATRARAWGSYDRRDWVPLGAFEFAKPLRYQGIGVSSHGQRRGAKFLFVPAKPTEAPPFDRSALIGGDNDHAGWVDWTGDGRWLTRGFSVWKPKPSVQSRSRRV